MRAATAAIAMKPVLILQHLTQDGPAYLGRWLHQRALPFEVCNTQAGEAFPSQLTGYSALAVLGGEMSANDPLPALRDAERLILQAMDSGVPVLGHCLGGQLMARALGARVVDSPRPEIGWQRLRIRPGAEARAWFGERAEACVFQWHYEAFELPPGATWLAHSEACTHQAFAVGAHLAMQFHVELDEAKLHAWAGADDRRFAAVRGEPSVQSGADMLREAEAHLTRQHRLADCIYSRWLSGVGC
jgi:GMP synthase-like glutamine amidotransferase